MPRFTVVLLAVALLGVTAGCGEKPQYADPAEARKADENRISAIQNNPNLTPAQRDWQINRIRKQMQPQGR